MRPAQLKFSLAGGARPAVLIACLAIVGLLALAAVMASWQGSGEGTVPGINGAIAFDSNRGGDYEIFVMDSAGQDQAPLTANLVTDHVGDRDVGDAWLELGIGTLAVVLGLLIGLVVLSGAESPGGILFSILLIVAGVFLVALGIRQAPWAV